MQIKSVLISENHEYSVAGRGGSDVKLNNKKIEHISHAHFLTERQERIVLQRSNAVFNRISLIYELWIKTLTWPPMGNHLPV